MKKVLVGILGKGNLSEEDIYTVTSCSVSGKRQFIVYERKP